MTYGGLEQTEQTAVAIIQQEGRSIISLHSSLLALNQKEFVQMVEILVF